MKYLEEYLKYLKYQKNYSQETIDSYEEDLVEFFDFIDGLDINILKVKYEDIRDYLKYLDDKKNKATTVSRKLSSLRGFYKFLINRDYVKNNPFTLIKTPRKEKKLPRFFYYNELEEMFDSIDISNALGQRNRLILEVLYASGVRVSELVNIKIKDIDLKNKSITVFGKGKKTRIVYFGLPCKEKIERYLSIRNSDSEYLLLNKRGNKLSDRSVRTIFEDIIKKNHLDITFSPHTLRHTYATHMLNEGMDVRSVQELLGHSSISTTGIYTHVSNEQLRNVYLKSHPRGK